MMQEKLPAVALLIPTLLFAGCYKSVDQTDGNVTPDTADTADGYEVPPDLLPDFVPDLPPDPMDVPPDIPPDYPPDFPPEDVPPITAEEFCLGFADGVCGYLVGCCTDAEIEELGLMEVNCFDPMDSEIFRECLSQFGDAVRAGLIVVDYGGYYVMLAELNEVEIGCPNFGTSPFMKDFLYRLWTGTALLGQLDEGLRCTIDEECREGLYCSVYTGLCTETVRIGGVCRDDAECGLGGVCNRGRCAEPQSVGGPCNDYEDCDVGLWCDSDTCRNALPSGTQCTFEEMNCQGLCTMEFPMGTCRDFCNGY